MNRQRNEGQRKTRSRWKGWLAPNAGNLYPYARIGVGLALNIVTILRLRFGIGIISNLENKYYEPINLRWQWTASLGSIVAIMALVPVLIFTKKPFQRWLAAILISLPLMIAFAEWFQWFDFLIAHGLELH